MAAVVFHQIQVMFLILALGYIAMKTGVFTEDMVERLSSFLLQVIVPMVMFVSYQIEYSADRLKSLLIVAGLSALAFIMQILIATLMVRKKGDDRAIERMSVMYSNAGFFTIPLVWQLLGREGVFYITGYLTLFNIMFWTHGVILVAGSTTFRDILKKLRSPAILGMIIGLIFFVTQIRVPTAVLEAMEMIGSMNVPVAMLVAGATIAKAPLVDSFRQPRIYWVSAVKLLILPFVSILVLSLLPITFTMALVIILATAAPAGATITMLAITYDRNSTYASQIFVTSTLLAIVTIPLVVAFAQFVNGG